MYNCLTINKLHIYNIYNKVRGYCAMESRMGVKSTLISIAQKCNDYKTAKERTERPGA